MNHELNFISYKQTTDDCIKLQYLIELSKQITYPTFKIFQSRFALHIKFKYKHKHTTGLLVNRTIGVRHHMSTMCEFNWKMDLFTIFKLEHPYSPAH